MRERAIGLVGMLILLVVNGVIWQKERLRADGRVVLLALAPVDPRSLMQGDYMRLRYALENELMRQLPAERTASADGYAIVSLDREGVATLQRLTATVPATLGDSQWPLRYRLRQGELLFASNAFFFEEGQADAYAHAHYGEFRVDRAGQMLLVALRDEQRRRLGNK